MTRASTLAVLTVLCGAAAARAQSVPQATEQYGFQFNGDALWRDEWTRDVFQGPNQERWRLQVRPRVEVGLKWLLLGVGAEFNHSEDENDEAPGGGTPALVRDNYRSRDTRLDLAFASLKPAEWLRIEGGRFPMPIAFTEMIWDRDIRPQGAAVHLGGGGSRFGVSALAARGSHAYEDDETEMLILSASLGSPPEARTKLELVASYLLFRETAALEPAIRRQNTRAAAGGPLALDYHVLDGVLRLRNEGVMPWQIAADVCFNTAADADRVGVWLALVLGSTRTARSRFEYTYAKVDKDATLAAYATDDFFWGTGWEGHRGDVGVRLYEGVALHAVGQLQRFKDSARAEERDHWLKRYRVELRVTY
ncbi:MAG TPA: putative porin [Vicinamibacteria bacterium]